LVNFGDNLIVNMPFPGDINSNCHEKMNHIPRFSKRNGFHQAEEPPITIREGAPDDFRAALIQIAYEFGFKPTPLRNIVCRILRKRPDPSNWSDYPNVDEEVHDLVETCDWFYVYDILEAIAASIQNGRGGQNLAEFESEINDVFVQQGIGWKLEDGLISFRGSEGLDTILKVAAHTERQKGHNTAANELHEAIKDMSRRPRPDPTGAIQHSIASLECVARDVSGSKETLGKWLRKNPDAFPRPLGEYVEKIWGFASEHGRHLVEAGEASMDEAELVLGLSATLGSYLSKKGQMSNRQEHGDFPS
jgi:hypothetical protein